MADGGLVSLYAALAVALVVLLGYLVYLHRLEAGLRADVARLERAVGHRSRGPPPPSTRLFEEE